MIRSRTSLALIFGIALLSFAEAPWVQAAVAVPNAKRDARVEAAVVQQTPAMIAARHRIHQNPELGNRELETAKLVAEFLRGLGLQVTKPD